LIFLQNATISFREKTAVFVEKNKIFVGILLGMCYDEKNEQEGSL